MHNLLKRTEIRLNGSEVNNHNHLSSIGNTPGLQPDETVIIKAEPGNYKELLSSIVKTESPYNPEQNDLDSQVKGFNCPSCQLTFKYHLHLKHHQCTNPSCSVQYYPEYDLKSDADADADTSNLNGTEDDLPITITIKTEPLHSTDPEVGVQRKAFQCPTCQLTFKYRLHLSHHLNNNDACVKECSQTNDVKTEDRDTSNSNAQVKHSCHKCKKKFNTINGLRRHMEEAHRPYVCSTCQQSFKHEHTFLYHTQLEHPFKCEYCKLGFPCKSNLDAHMNNCHQDRITNMSIEDDNPGSGTTMSRRMFPCPECTKVYGKSVHLRSHMALHSNIRTRNNLALSFARKRKLNSHRNGIYEGDKSDTAVSRNNFSCPECEKVFDGFVDLRTHMEIHFKERPYICSKCLLTFKIENNLNRHIQIEHLFKCLNCELSFLKKNSVEAHVLKWHPEEIRSKGYKILNDKDKAKKNGTAASLSVSQPEHYCPECKKEFASFFSLYNHTRRIHSQERPYVCSKCQHSFKSLQDRDVHTRNDHRFQCTHCELSFVRHSSLEEHGMENHQAVFVTGNSCPECKKEFSRQSNLREHMKIHSNERLYVCSKCLKTFKHKNHLTVHSLRDHVLKCDKCSLLFVSQYDLTQHLSQHTAEEEVT